MGNERKIVNVNSTDVVARIFGNYDINVRIIEQNFRVNIQNRPIENGDAIVISGDSSESVSLAAEVVEYLKKIAEYNDAVSEQSVQYVSDMIKDGRGRELSDFGDDCICLTNRGKPIKAKTVGQKQYVDKIKKNTIVFGVGPAGTGKTFLAVAMAVKALRDKQVSRIILTRPAIEAGEKLGFLPGDLQSKIDPYWC